MRNSIAVCSAVAVVASACGPSDPSAQPTHVNIDIVGMTVGPALIDGSFWDGSGTVPTDIKNRVTQALSAVNPYAGVVTVLAEAVLAGTQAPDPFGTAEISIDGTYRDDLSYSLFADVNSNFEDTYTPALSGGWRNLELASVSRLRLRAYDEDLINNDPIGVVEISASEIQKALDAGIVYHVNVAGQSQNQLLFVDISVQRITR